MIRVKKARGPRPIPTDIGPNRRSSFISRAPRCSPSPHKSSTSHLSSIIFLLSPPIEDSPEHKSLSAKQTKKQKKKKTKNKSIDKRVRWWWFRTAVFAIGGKRARARVVAECAVGGRRGAKGGRHTAGRSPAVARRPTSTTSQPSPFQPPEHAGETGDSAALRSAGATCLAVGPYAPPPPSPPLPTVARCTPRWLDLASELPPVLLPSAPPMRLSRPTENRTRALPPLLLLLLPSTRPRPSFREQRTRVPTPRFATRRHLAASASRRAAKDNPE